MEDEILTLSQFAKKLQVSRPIVIKLIEQGIINAFRLSDVEGSHYRIKESEIEKLINYRLENRREPTNHPDLNRSHSIWKGMISRCHDPKNLAFPCYGAKGITVCERWQEWQNFIDDMGPAPKGWSIDRLNNDLGYSPENCVWSTSLGQARNKKKAILYDCDGMKVTLPHYCKLKNLKYTKIFTSLKKGLSLDEAVKKERDLESDPNRIYPRFMEKRRKEISLKKKGE